MSEEFPENIGPYKVLRELGRGAMGTVYLARQESLSRDLAIKVLAAEFTRDQEFVARFRREGLISSKLRHPNIVQVFDYSAQDNLYYIAMEYVGPEDLQAYLRANHGRLPQAEAVRLMGQVLSALECAHEAGVTHRDVKPANILMSPRQDAVLTDFSIANMQEAQRLTQTGAMMGTPDYMAPEQFDAKQVDKRSDLYSVGVVLYEMITGERAFPGDTVVQVMKAQLMHVPEAPHKIDPGVPEALSLPGHHEGPGKGAGKAVGFSRRHARRHFHRPGDGPAPGGPASEPPGSRRRPGLAGRAGGRPSTLG